MKTLWKSTTFVASLVTSSILFSACEGSRPRRIYESGKSVYEDYEKTGDPTWLILFIVLGLLVGGLWLWNKKKKD